MSWVIFKDKGLDVITLNMRAEREEDEVRKTEGINKGHRAIATIQEAREPRVGSWKP